MNAGPLYLAAGSLVGALVARAASRRRPKELCPYCGEKAADGRSGWCWHCHGLGRCDHCELAALEVRASVNGIERRCTLFHMLAERSGKVGRSDRIPGREPATGERGPDSGPDRR